MPVKVAINGFGRIGRNVLKLILADSECGELVEVVAVNDLTDAPTLAHLYKYDSVQGVNSQNIAAEDDNLIIDGKKIKITAVSDPALCPWGVMNVDVVIESTGRFTKREDAAKHLQAGAKRVIISAPATDPDVTLVLGVNDGEYKAADHKIVSNASCTTNCLAPVAKVLNEKLGIR
ncbi:MAG: aldehyde dehydrogenase, partial [Nitrospina sp.]|nr:aldehyde dehydrogenase [Nitrospina sp.]